MKKNNIDKMVPVPWVLVPVRTGTCTGIYCTIQVP